MQPVGAVVAASLHKTIGPVKMCRAQSCSGLVESDEVVATYLWLPSARRQFDITSARYPLVNMLPL